MNDARPEVRSEPTVRSDSPEPVLFYGNQGNAAFRLASWVRRAGVDARLLLPHRIRSERSRPEWEDPSLEGDYPEWVERYQARRWLDWLVPPERVRSMGRDAPAVVVTGSEIVGGLTLDAPVVFFPMGWEFTDLPFSFGPKDLPRAVVYRQRLPRVSRILSAQENVHETARRLGVGDRAVRYALPVDTRALHERVNRELLADLEQRYADRDAVFLLLSRKTMDPDRPDYKAPEKFAVALERFCRTARADDVAIVVGDHGRDADEFRSLLRRLGVEEKCDFVDHLRRPDLHAYFSLRNAVVFDQFGGITRHNLSGSPREAMGLGAVLVTATAVESEEFRAAYGPDCPLLYAETEDEICGRMRDLSAWSEEKFESYRRRALAWSERNLDWRSRISDFVDILADAADDPATDRA